MIDDSWIKSYSPIAAEKLHALGYINLIWNVTEYWLNALLASVSGLSEDMCRMFVYDLGDVAISDRIRTFSATRAFDRPMMAAIERALGAYDICRLNRNHLNHFALASRSGHKGLRLHKIAKKPKRELMPIPDDLEDIRRVGEEISALKIFLEHLALATWKNAKAPPPPSLDTLPLPQRLWTPPQTDQSIRKRQRQ
jgi:hypothetical protein